MNKKLIVFAGLFALLNLECTKNKTVALDLSGITQTDAVGNSIGPVDNTDWTQDNTWNSNESNLFDTPTAAQLSGTQTCAVTVGPAFPNPAGSTIMFYFTTSGITLVQMVITDKYLHVQELHYFMSTTGSNFFQLALQQAMYANNTSYRLYYAFYSLADGRFYKGHGDIRISR